MSDYSCCLLIQITALPTIITDAIKLLIKFEYPSSDDMKSNNERVYRMSFASVYPHYIAKVEKKGRTIAELNEVITWLTGYDDQAIQQHIDEKTNFQDFFARASLHPNVTKITGVICGYRIEEIEDEVMRQVRYLDKLVDELAKGRAMDKILRK